LRELVHQFEPKLFLQTSRCLDYYLWRSRECTAMSYDH
jgi:hypothetical protein